MRPVTVRNGRLYLTPRFSVSFQAVPVPSPGSDGANRSLGLLPVCRARDFAGVPYAWKSTGSLFVPLDDELTFWLGLWTERGRPHALKVRAGALNAVSGRPWDDDELRADPQNYVVSPPQWAIDGVRHSNGTIRPFSPTRGLAVSHPPIELTVFGPQPGIPMPEATPPRAPSVLHDVSTPSEPLTSTSGVIPDPWGPSAWTTGARRRAGMYVVSGAEYERLTGRARPRFRPHDRPVPRLP